MATKPMIWREFENLPKDAQIEIERIICQMSKTLPKASSSLHKTTAVAKAQAASIKKWAGKIDGAGFGGRDHDKILYGD